MDYTAYTGGWVQFIFKRLLLALPTLLVIIILNFAIVQLAPGDAVDVLAGESGGASAEYMQQIRERFGLDQSMFIQLFYYVKNILSFDLGYSFRENMPVRELILGRLGPTLILMGSSLVLSLFGGILFGLLAGSFHGSWLDAIISGASLVIYATPLFWVGLMLIVIFSVNLGWLPTSGMETIGAFHQGWSRLTDIGKHLILPTITLSLFYMALYTRLMRSTTIEQIAMDYVVTERAMGLTERQIVWRHVLRNSVLPVVTMAGVQLGSMLGGSVVVETVFGWPGAGLLAFQALFARDVNLLLGIFFISACLVTLTNLLTDCVLALLDPRINMT